MKKKIFVLLPDGVGLKNFAYTKFYDLGINHGFEIIYWNNTPCNLKELGYNEIKIKSAKSHPKSEIFKNARKHIELSLFTNKFNDKVYDTYRFPLSFKGGKRIVKSILTKLLIGVNPTNKKLVRVRSKINKLERQTSYYHECISVLKKEKPDLIFCTNQRPLLAIAPLLAAKDLRIPTTSFIFSWDNLPKATMVVETDYYLVWSDYMKKELLNYYNYISENQIYITGTPQFECHFESNRIIKRETFYNQHNLDSEKEYICYSGDDITTCPDDQDYLRDVANAVKNLNSKGYNLGIIFRPCPADFSDRYDEVLKDYSNIIVKIAPLWEKKGGAWDTIIPNKSDLDLQVNTIAHSSMVINLGSSMVFDYVAHNKPCAYINYDVINKKVDTWSVKTIYSYVHFRSMPSSDSVLWIDKQEQIIDCIERGVASKNDIEFNLKEAKNWFTTINKEPATNASNRIWAALIDILQ